MVGALLAETNDDWQDRPYFDMTEYYEWKATLVATPNLSSKPTPKRRKAA